MPGAEDGAGQVEQVQLDGGAGLVGRPGAVLGLGAGQQVVPEHLAVEGELELHHRRRGGELLAQVGPADQFVHQVGGRLLGARRPDHRRKLLLGPVRRQDQGADPAQVGLVRVRVVVRRAVRVPAVLVLSGEGGHA